MAQSKRVILPLTDADEAEIQRQIANDPDAPEATDEELAQAKPFAEAFPELAASIRATRGAQKAPKKIPMSIRVDADVLAYFKATGEGWHGRMNDALRKAAGL